MLVYHLLLLFLAKSSQRNLEFMQLLELLESMLCFLQAIGINLFCGDAFFFFEGCFTVGEIHYSRL